MYRLVAIDLDGTLLNSNKQISKENIRTLNEVIEKGVAVIVCSGRIFEGAKIFARQIGSRYPLVACNGAVVKDLASGEQLYGNPLSREDCYKVIDICKRENIYYHVYIGDTMYTERLEYSALFYWNKNRELPENEQVSIKLVDRMKEAIAHNNELASKIVVISRNPESLLSVREQMEAIGSVDVTSSNFDNFEVVNKGVNKGNAVKFVGELLKIDKCETIAIGDNENDYSMIKYAGLGIAMGNAEKSIKEIADHVTLTNDENGVSEALKKFIL